MQKQRIGRRAMPEFLFPAQHQRSVANASRQVGLPEIEFPGMAQGLAGLRKNIEYRLAVLFLDAALEIADIRGGDAHCQAISGHGAEQQPAIGIDDGGRVDPGGAEIKQDQSTGRRVIAVVGKVRVGLDELEIKNFPEQQGNQQTHRAIPFGLRGVDQRFDRHSAHTAHGEDVLCRQIGVHFELMLLREKGERLDVDEAPLPNELPRDYVMRVVRLKAEAARRSMRDRKLPERAILTADTTVTLDAAILGKPTDRADAVRMLEKLSGQTHQVLTAVAVADAKEVREALSTSFVTFEKMSADEIKRYVETGEPMDKAGAYAVQGLAAKYISKISKFTSRNKSKYVTESHN